MLLGTAFAFLGYGCAQLVTSPFALADDPLSAPDVELVAISSATSLGPSFVAGVDGPPSELRRDTPAYNPYYVIWPGK